METCIPMMSLCCETVHKNTVFEAIIIIITKWNYEFIVCTLDNKMVELIKDLTIIIVLSTCIYIYIFHFFLRENI